MNDLHVPIRQSIDRRCQRLAQTQASDGSWHYCFEGPLMDNAFTTILLRSLKTDGCEPLIQALARDIMHRQQLNGTWNNYPDEPNGNLSATIQAYTALLYTGVCKRSDENMKKAERFIRAEGGLDHADILTKVMLAMNGHYPWPLIRFPLSFLLLPSKFPVNFYELSSYARVHFVPVMLCADKKFHIKNASRPDLSHLRLGNMPHWLSFRSSSLSYVLKEQAYKLSQLPFHLFHAGIKQAERYMLDRIEPNGTLCTYASSTIFMVYALLALGYDKHSPAIQNALKGVLSYVWQTKSFIHVQNSPSTVWDTALLTYALERAGLKQNRPVIEKGAAYLLRQQQTKKGDWSIHNPNTAPGGWGFSEHNTINPDIDDTQAALHAIAPFLKLNSRYLNAWHRGVRWLLSMQNDDGGWAAFEKNTGQAWMTLLPVPHMKNAGIDRSTADITGRVLAFLGSRLKLDRTHPRVKAAIRWLMAHQKADGSWYGRWCVCYLYGTWAAVTGLRAVGVPANAPAIRKAVSFLKQTQRPDGGWGESCTSAAIDKFQPLPFSTPSQTAWAVNALTCCSDDVSPEVEKGCLFLTKTHRAEEISYPTGIGLPGEFYIRYHSYDEIWPLLALSEFRNKWNG
ncbi:MAG TPA: squalene--hopene cyclase [Bacillales bacterium]|nr:squalene--hopene cyclase [Bacillales bacterium]